MPRQENKEESGSPGFVSGNVVGCFSSPKIFSSQSIHLLRCGPRGLAPLPGLPSSLAERRVEKQPA